MAITVYGIPNCDTVKKARSWLDSHSMSYGFHDYKKAGANREQLERWCRVLGWESVLNRAGTTFKTLPEAEKLGLDQAKAVELMLKQPAMIKRPIVEHPGGLLLGFKPENWETALSRR